MNSKQYIIQYKYKGKGHDDLVFETFKDAQDYITFQSTIKYRIIIAKEKVIYETNSFQCQEFNPDNLNLSSKQTYKEIE